MRTVAAVAVFCWLAFALGVFWGASWGAGREREQAAAAGASAVVAVPTPRLSLLCANGDPPREWTQAEAEARYHTAAQWLRTAEEHGVWNDKGRRAVMLAVGQLLEVVLCR